MGKTVAAEVDTPAPSVEGRMTEEERVAYLHSIARARAQYEAGEAIQGEAVFKWLASWGTDHELPPPPIPIRQA